MTRTPERISSATSPARRAHPERFITIWCPDWPVVAAGVPADHPAAVLAAHRVVARTPAAAADGVVIGQRRRQAQSRCPRVQLIDHDPSRDAREFESVVQAVVDVAPRLDVVEPGWICLASRGPARYFGGDLAVAEHLTGVVAGVVAEVVAAQRIDGVAVGVGVADGRFASGVAARLSVRRGQPVVIEPGGAPAFCAPLSIGWLQTLGEIDGELVDLFTRLGLQRLGDLAELPVTDVLGRFGHAGVHAHRLANGADERPGSTEDPAPERRITRSFDDPVAQSEAVVFVAKQLADELAGRLAGDGRICTRLVVQFETEHGERSERSWYRSTGLTASAMVERVRWQLDAWMRLPRGSEGEITAGVALVRLVPEEVRADDGVQLGLWGGQSDADRRAGRAIARLTTLTSEQAVTVPVWQGGRLPSERYRWTPATTVDLDHRGASAVDVSEERDAVVRPPWPGSLPPPSPARVHDPALPIEVVDAAGRLVEVSGRGVVSAAPVTIRSLIGSEAEGWRRGLDRPVRAWAGPWPVDQRWWEPERHRRLARFQVQIDGAGEDAPDEQVLLVVAERRRWWLAAQYD